MTRSATGRWANASQSKQARLRWRRRFAITLLAPMPPLLFMGEEWGANEPFPSSAISRSRWLPRCAKAAARSSSPHMRYTRGHSDPLEEATFRAAVLDWDARRAVGTRAPGTGERPSGCEAAPRSPRIFRRPARARQSLPTTCSRRLAVARAALADAARQPV